MARHYFDLTNGEDFVIDRKGAAIRTKADMLRRSRMAAGHLINQLPRYGGWSKWLVCVHDADGRQVAVLPFLGAADDLIAPTAPVRHRTTVPAWRNASPDLHAIG